jgi:hypothetical protein
MNRFDFSISDSGPHIRVSVLPDAEQGDARAIAFSVKSLRSYVEAFHTALALLQETRWVMREIEKDESRRESPYLTYSGRVKLLAAGQGAMTLYHFGCATEGVKRTLHRCPTLAEMVDREALAKARDEFWTAFPNWIHLRHAVAHRAELAENKEALAENSISDCKGIEFPGIKIGVGLGGDFHLSGGLFNDTFLATFRGKRVRYDLNDASLAKLDTARVHFWNAFKPAADKTSAMSAKRRNDRQPA